MFEQQEPQDPSSPELSPPPGIDKERFEAARRDPDSLETLIDAMAQQRRFEEEGVIHPPSDQNPS